MYEPWSKDIVANKVLSVNRLTPEGHKYGEVDSDWVVEKVGDLGKHARLR